jgi:hypothetical protein
MGYNRSGDRRTARMKRRKKLENRLAQKAAASEAPQKESVTHKVKEMAKSAVEKVEGALHTAVEKVKGAVK